MTELLNHGSGAISGVAAVYNRYAYNEEKRAALETWARTVEAIIPHVDTNILPIRAGFHND